MAGAALLVVAVRLWVSRHAQAIEIVADEAGYLGTARLLGQGGARWSLGQAGTYSPGYGLLISPWYRIADDPHTIYRAVIVTNAVLGGLTVPLVFAMARRVTVLRSGPAVLASLAVAVSPAVATHANWAWAENLTLPTYLLLALATMRLLERPDPGRALFAGAICGPAYAVHARLLPCVAVVVGVLAVAGWRRWLPRPAAAGALAVAVVGLGAAQLLDQVVVTRLWEAGNDTSQVTSSLENLTKVRDIAVGTAGQAWYQLVATAGLVGFGALALVRAAGAGRGAESPGADHRDVPPVVLDDDARPDAAQHAGRRVLRSDAVVLGLLTLAGFATSVVFMAGRDRADHLVYGRYNDTLAPPLVLAGIGVLATERVRRRLVGDGAATVAVLLVAAAVLWRLELDQLGQRLTRATVLGVMAFNGDAPALRLLDVTAAATIVAVVVIALAVALAVASPPGHGRLGRARAPVVAGVLLAVAAASLVRVDTTIRRDPDVERRVPQIVAITDGLVRPGEVIRYKTFLRSTTTGAYEKAVPETPFYMYQLYLPDNPVVRQTPWVEAPASPFTISIESDLELRAAGARIAYIDPFTRLALWVERGPRFDDLAAAGKLLPAGFPAVLPVESLRGGVAFDGQPRVDGREVQARVRVRSRSNGSPWPVNQDRVNPVGMVRLGFRFTDPRCRCMVASRRANLPGQVPAGAATTVDATVSLAGLDPGRYDVEVFLLQEGFTTFGSTDHRSVGLG